MSRGRSDKLSTNFGRPAPKIWESKKSSKIRPISDNFRLWSRISPERIHISKIGKVAYQLPPLPRWLKKVGVLWFINGQCTFFGRLYISSLRACCPFKFLHVLEIDQGLLAHTPSGAGSGAGVPQNNFNRGNLKFGLIFSVLESITSGLVEVSSQNFCSRRSVAARGISTT